MNPDSVSAQVPDIGDGVKFPVGDKLKHVWAMAVHRNNWAPSKHSRICSKHFESYCFLDGGKRKVLCRNAVPTIFTDLPPYLQKIPTDMSSETSIDNSENMIDEIVPPNTMHCQTNETIDLTKEDILKSKSLCSTESASDVLASSTTDLTITRQLENICRLCLKEKGTWDLTRPYKSNTGEEVFNDMLWLCFLLKIPRLTCCGVSKLMCSDCAVSLTQAYHFKQQVVEATATFNSYCDRNLEDTPESEYPICKAGATVKRPSKTPLLRQLLQKAPLNINDTEKINENDNMSTSTPTNVPINVVNYHNYSNSGQEDIPTSTNNKIEELNQQTSEEIQIQPQRKELPVKKSIRKRKSKKLPTTTKKAGNTGIKKLIRRFLSARNPNKSGNKESDNPINDVEDTVIEVKLDTVINDSELDTVINEDQLDNPIKHVWEIPRTEKNEPSTFQFSMPHDDCVFMKEEYDLEIKDEFDKYRTGMEDFDDKFHI